MQSSKPPTPLSRKAVVAEARSWLGVRWLHQGRNRHGIDCVGLVVVVRRALDLDNHDLAGYPREPNGTFLSYFFNAGGIRVPIPQALPGDLLLFRDAVWPCHVAIVTQRDGDLMHMIHAHTTRRKVLEEPVLHEWKTKWVAAMRMPEID